MVSLWRASLTKHLSVARTGVLYKAKRNKFLPPTIDWTKLEYSLKQVENSLREILKIAIRIACPAAVSKYFGDFSADSFAVESYGSLVMGLGDAGSDLDVALVSEDESAGGGKQDVFSWLAGIHGKPPVTVVHDLVNGTASW